MLALPDSAEDQSQTYAWAGVYVCVYAETESMNSHKCACVCVCVHVQMHERSRNTCTYAYVHAHTSNTFTCVHECVHACVCTQHFNQVKFHQMLVKMTAHWTMYPYQKIVSLQRNVWTSTSGHSEINMSWHMPRHICYMCYENCLVTGCYHKPHMCSYTHSVTHVHMCVCKSRLFSN